MPPIELGPVRLIGAVDPRAIRTASGAPERFARAAPAPAAVVHSEVLDPGAPPIDAERVQIIRKAVESGTYPVVPAKIADAIIAAGLLLRNAR
jgi:negative regulator of flagellin synthesis FlgM